MTPYFMPQETQETMTAETQLEIAKATIDFQKDKILQLETELHEARHVAAELSASQADFNARVAQKVRELGITHELPR